MWMFCEGFYLHRLISAAFAEERSLILFYAIGWGEYSFYSEIDNLYSLTIRLEYTFPRQPKCLHSLKLPQFTKPWFVAAGIYEYMEVSQC
jgi:hypothetical protein